MSDPTITVNCYHKGSFELVRGELEYVDGIVTKFKRFDPDYMSWFQVEKAIRRLGYGGGIHKLWYKLPFETVADRKPLWEDTDENIRRMCTAAKWFKEIDLYVEHKISEPRIVEPPCLLEFNMDQGLGNEEDNVNVEPNVDDELNTNRDAELEDESDGVDMDTDLSGSDNQEDFEDEDDCDFVDVNILEEPVSGIDTSSADDVRSVLESDDCNDDSSKGYPDTPDSTDAEWENIEKKQKHKQRPPEGGYQDVYLSLMQEFRTGQEFKERLLRYSLLTGYNIKITRWGKTKLESRCSSSECSWRVYCSFNNQKQRWMIKTYADEHTCVKSGRTKILKIPQIAKLFLERIRRNPNFKAAEMRDELKREYNMSVTRNMCSKAKRKALDIVRGGYTIQFSKLWDYDYELHRSNPGITTDLQTFGRETDGTHVFHRFYICFEQLWTAWKQNCRPIIGLDGCFLKWAIKCQLLAAVGRDANNKIYPIAWAVVPIENTDNWEWFIQKLKHDLQIVTGVGLTILSDKQKGLLNVIKQELPEVEHRMCARHIYANWRKQHKDSMLKPLFWQVARSDNEHVYEDNLEILRQLNEEAHKSLLSTDPSTWCRAFFRTTSHCHDCHNNLSESFNKTIKAARSKPILDMLEDIRRQTMERIARRSVVAERWKGLFTPVAQSHLENARLEAQNCVMYVSTQGMFEIDDCGSAYTVSLTSKTCACRQWDLTGLPCKHAICAINENRLDVNDYVSAYYLASKWKELYRYSIRPVNGERLWRKTRKPPIGAPAMGNPLRNPVGRPKKYDRIKDPHESPTRKGTVSRHGRIMRCGICGQPGHNKATCKEKSKHTEQHPNIPPTRKRGRPRKEEKAESSSTVASRGNQGRATLTSTQASQNTASSHDVEMDGPNPTQSSQSSENQVRLRRRSERIPQGYGLYVSPTGNMYFRSGPRNIKNVTPSPGLP